MIRAENFINGQFEGCEGYLDSFEPGTGEVWAQIPDSGAEEVDRAVQAAKEAFKSWKKLSVNQRAQYLIKAANLLESRLDEFAIAESRDQVQKPHFVPIFENRHKSIEHRY